MKHREITEEASADLVEAFYAKVRRDALRGHLFNGAIDDWDQHLPKLPDSFSPHIP